MNLNSGTHRTYRGKFIEENLNSNGRPPYFKASPSYADTKLSVSLPFYKGCQTQTVTVDGHGIFEFNMTILNTSIPYTMRLDANKTGFDRIVVDYFVGGYPISDIVELGSFAFY